MKMKILLLRANLIYFGVLILALFTIAQGSILEKRGKHKKVSKGRAKGLSPKHPNNAKKGGSGRGHPQAKAAGGGGGGGGGGTRSGFATFYFLQTSGKPSCGVWAKSSDMVVALSRQVMGGYRGPNCGKTIDVHGDHGSITVRVVDTCARCGFNDIDLSPEAFKKIANNQQGKVKVTWSFN